MCADQEGNHSRYYSYHCASPPYDCCLQIRKICFSLTVPLSPTLHQYMNKWYRLEEEPIYHRCIPGVLLKREVSQLLLSIHSIHSYFHQGLYRCVADNATAPDNSSQPLAITINCEYGVGYIVTCISVTAVFYLFLMARWPISRHCRKDQTSWRAAGYAGF